MLESLFKLYGPLGMGWIVAGYLFIEYRKLQGRLMEHLIDDTQAKADLTQAVRRMTELLQQIV